MDSLEQYDYNWNKNKNNNKNLKIKEKKKNVKRKKLDGIKIANLNARGLIDKIKRNDLYLWLVKNDIDIMTIQEWYIHHQFENKTFDKTGFDGYEITQNKNNTKTLIIFKEEFEFIDLSEIICEEEGLDVTWMGVSNEKYVVAISSVYDRPFDKKEMK